MKVRIDEESCTGCGLCVDICPEIFELGEDGLAHVTKADPPANGCYREAADDCPSDAIIIED